MASKHQDSSTDLSLARVEACLQTSLRANYSKQLFESSGQKKVTGLQRILSKLGLVETKFRKRVEDVTYAILKTHGLTKDHLDVITRFEDAFDAYENMADESIDSNSNKASVTTKGILSETMASPNKLIGYRYLYRMIKKLYGKDKADYLMGRLYDYSIALNDSTQILIPYCFAADVSSLMLTGRDFGQLHSKPVNRVSSYVSVSNEIVHQFSNQIAGAIAIGTFFSDIAWIMYNKEQISLKTILMEFCSDHFLLCYTKIHSFLF